MLAIVIARPKSCTGRGTVVSQIEMRSCTGAEKANS